jgi:hypothetical protein
MSGTTLGDAMPAIPLVIAHSHFGLMWIVAVAAGLAALGATTAAVRQGSVIRSCSPNGGSWPNSEDRHRAAGGQSLPRVELPLSDPLPSFDDRPRIEKGRRPCGRDGESMN